MLKEAEHPNIIKIIEHQEKDLLGIQAFTTELMTGTILERFRRGYIPSDSTFINWIK